MDAAQPLEAIARALHLTSPVAPTLNEPIISAHGHHFNLTSFEADNGFPMLHLQNSDSHARGFANLD